MGKRGPQPQAPEHKRDKRFGMYFSDVDLAQLERRSGLPGLADHIRMSVPGVRGGTGKGQPNPKKNSQLTRQFADYVRGQLLLGPAAIVVPEVNRDLEPVIRGAVTNLNQLAHHANSLALAGLMGADDMVATLREAAEAGKQLQLKLTGVFREPADDASAAVGDPWPM